MSVQQLEIIGTNMAENQKTQWAHNHLYLFQWVSKHSEEHRFAEKFHEAMVLSYRNHLLWFMDHT